MVHPTKKDAWLLVLVTAIVLFLAGQGIYRLAVEERTWLAVMFFCIAGFLALVFYSFAEYEVIEAHLVIRSHLYRFRFGSIPLGDIQQVFPTRNPLSAPAWSLDRLQIDYLKNGKQRFGLVSPTDREAFYRDLTRAEPALVREGDRLVRKK